MRWFACIAALLFCLCSELTADGKAASREVSIKAADGVLLRATYFPAEKRGPAVLFFHQCSRQRALWTPLSSQMIQLGYHVLVVSPRGTEDSGGEQWDYDGSLDHALTYWREKWGTDAADAFQWLVSQPKVDRSKVVAAGAGCGAFMAILAAEQHPEIKRLVQLSGFEDRDTRAYVARTPALAIFNVASAQDSMSAAATETLKRVSKNPASEFTVYPEKGHGISLVERYPGIQTALINWLKAKPSGTKSD